MGLFISWGSETFRCMGILQHTHQILIKWPTMDLRLLTFIHLALSAHHQGISLTMHLRIILCIYVLHVTVARSTKSPTYVVKLFVTLL